MRGIRGQTVSMRVVQAASTQYVDQHTCKCHYTHYAPHNRLAKESSEGTAPGQPYNHHTIKAPLMHPLRCGMHGRITPSSRWGIIGGAD